MAAFNAILNSENLGRILIRASLFLALILSFQACQEISLVHVESRVCSYYKDVYGDEACVLAEGVDTPRGYDFYSYEETVGQVDLLFVVDESTSMSRDQEGIGEQFSDLLAGPLGSLDYQIAITTMSYGGQGNLLPFDTGSLVLKSAGLGESTRSKNLANLASFKKRIRSERSAQCQGYLDKCLNNSDLCNEYKSSQCGDDSNFDQEQGVCAAGNAMSNIAFRPNAHLAVVFLTDEDVAKGEVHSVCKETGAQGLLDKVRSDANLKRRLMSFSTISVLDQGCVQQRKEESPAFTLDSDSVGDLGRPGGPISFVPAEVGVEYQTLANTQDLGDARVVQGNEMSICEDGYGFFVSQMGAHLEEYRKILALPCSIDSVAEDVQRELWGNSDQIRVYVNDVRLGASQFRVENGVTLSLQKNLNPRSKVRVEMYCPTDI